MVRYFVGIWFLLMGLVSFAQSPFTEVRVAKPSVYVGQPAEVVVSVYTPTWFTKGVQVQNISVNGAFTVFFRSVSVSKVINGQNYAGVEFYYHVFPFKPEPVTFPALRFTIETPKVGDYKGVKRTLTSKARDITVKNIPLGFTSQNWLVCSGQKVSQRWSTNSSTVEVGQVVTRTITREAFGTVAELIPEFQWDSVQGVSLYAKTPEITNNKTKTSISGQMQQTMQYLFEQEGEVVFPKMELLYYHPVYKKQYKKTLPSRTFHVKPAKNNAVLASVMDSLQSQTLQPTAHMEASQPWYRNIPWLTILKLVGIVIGLYLAYKVILFLRLKWLKAVSNITQTEAYYFYQFLSALKVQNNSHALKSIYAWLMRTGNSRLTVSQFIQTYGNQKLIDQNQNYIIGNSLKLKGSVTLWRKARKRYKAELKMEARTPSGLNP